MQLLGQRATKQQVDFKVLIWFDVHVSVYIISHGGKKQRYG